MVEGGTPADRLFKSESNVGSVSTDSSPCSQYPYCKWGSNCKGVHAYSLPSYLTPKNAYHPRSTSDEEVDQKISHEAGLVVEDSEVADLMTVLMMYPAMEAILMTIMVYTTPLWTPVAAK